MYMNSKLWYNSVGRSAPPKSCLHIQYITATLINQALAKTKAPRQLNTPPISRVGGEVPHSARQALTGRLQVKPRYKPDRLGGYWEIDCFKGFLYHPADIMRRPASIQDSPPGNTHQAGKAGEGNAFGELHLVGCRQGIPHFLESRHIGSGGRMMSAG